MYNSNSLEIKLFSSNGIPKLFPDRVRGLGGLIFTRTSEIEMNTSFVLGGPSIFKTGTIFTEQFDIHSVIVDIKDLSNPPLTHEHKSNVIV